MGEEQIQNIYLAGLKYPFIVNFSQMSLNMSNRHASVTEF